jgi:hypothetical protein
MKWLFMLVVTASVGVSPVLQAWAAEETVDVAERNAHRQLGMRKCLSPIAFSARAPTC